MTSLAVLIELQSIHDNLRTIEQDLSTFPPDLAALDAEIKTLGKQIDTATKTLAEQDIQLATLQKNLAEAQKHEVHARNAVKASTHKVQYTAAIRDLDECERQRNTIQRPLKETETKHAALAAELESLRDKHKERTASFQELHGIFLSEHENQVVAREQLNVRRAELEQEMPKTELTHFNKLLQTRQGKAVTTTTQGICDGCHTKVRLPLLNQLREQGVVTCEYCQRLLFVPGKA